MRKWLKHCAAAALILIVVLVVIHYLRPPGISVGKSLPQGKVKPQFAFNGLSAAALLAPDGSLWAWGGTDEWPLFLFPQYTNFPIPRRIGSDSNWTQAALGSDDMSALKNDGSLWVWGIANRYGPPTRIGTETDWRQICTGGGHYLALKEDGSLWAWGINFLGQLGDGTTEARAVPTMIGTDRDWRTITAIGNTSLSRLTAHSGPGEAYTAMNVRFRSNSRQARIGWPFRRAKGRQPVGHTSFLPCWRSRPMEHSGLTAAMFIARPRTSFPMSLETLHRSDRIGIGPKFMPGWIHFLPARRTAVGGAAAKIGDSLDSARTTL